MPEFDTEVAAPAIYYGENVPDWQFRENFAPLPGGTMNANLAYRGIPAPIIPPDVEYTENDRRLIQRNEDERYAALGIDPIRARKAQAEVEEAAVRFGGQREYQQLVRGGATPEEALRRTADKLFFNHPDKLASYAAGIQSPAPDSINATPVMNPETGKPMGYAVIAPPGVNIHASQFNTAAKPDLGFLAQQRVLQGQMEAARKVLIEAQKKVYAPGATPEEKQDAARQALGAQRRLSEIESNYINRAKSPTMPKEAVVPTNAPAIFQKGQRARQNGVLYEFDGQNWNPVSG